MTRRVAPAWSRAILAALALALAGAAPLRADPGCSAAPASASRAWPAPLDRPVSLQARDISLRTALDRLAAAARVDLAYSADLLPLDRPVCVSRQAAALGDVLQELLSGTAAEAVVAAPGHVVLAPSRRAEAEASQLSMAPVELDRIVVTGTPGGTSERSLPMAVDVLGHRQLGALATGTLAQALDAGLPGIWAWEQSPSSLGVRYGSIRGASSFGVSYPKVYIDGIEVANPLLLSRFGSEGIERIEVIRGPQGAALYGTDAISGVVNVITRHHGADSEGGRLRLRSSVGAADSRFATGQSLAQEHELAAHFGSAVRSAGVTLSGGSMGAYVPGGFERHLMGTATGRAVGEHSITTATLRLSTQSAGAPASPVLTAPLRQPVRMQLHPLDGDDDAQATAAAGPQSARQYTAGITTTFTPDERWTHTLVAGVDGDRLRGAQLETGRTPLLEGTALEASDGSADRGTLRASSVARLGSAAGTSGTVTFTGEHSQLRESFAHPGASRVERGQSTWQRTTAGLAQGTLGLRDALFVTAGVRAE
ncbi:MAG TPA: TonB-dependent receptor plug domain-containing protein, partial [Longimicrobiaceae bacterium]|nr:TonB-dependent receptor plug domain-containing protein [Longimicrobiaceae bacterium]